MAATKELELPVFVSNIGRAITPGRANLVEYRESLTDANDRVKYYADLNRFH